MSVNWILILFPNRSRVNSKAQLRVPLERLLPVVPTLLHPGIRLSRYFAGKTDSLLLEADDSRKQAANRDACYDKLLQLLKDVGHDCVPGETSQEQVDKVKGLKRKENENRLRSKKQLSAKKAARSSRRDDS